MIKLYYMNPLCCEWLESQFVIDDSNYEEIINAYVKLNNPIAERLSDKWEANGETDCRLFVCVDNVSVSHELYVKCVNLVDKL